ncbi:MAG: peptide ABC transporter substrate-binding protein [Deltaproteobacteria bacterium]|nr:peptide ABC transporter substrate-binding protein [Deltaproteobacteria bacterium]
MKLFRFLLFIGFASTAFATHQGILRLHIESEPSTLDPAQARGVREFQILQSIFEGLTRYNPKTLEPLPAVAEKWSVSKDGRRYTFVLRQDAKWSDGKPVTAQDFWNGWEYLLNPKTKSPYAFQLCYLVGAKQYAEGKLKDPKQIGMKVLAPQVFEVTLVHPVPYFLSLTSFMALFPRRIELSKPETINNGPYKLVELPAGETGVKLEPNQYYWEKNKVRLQGIHFRPFGDFKTALKFYDRTGIDVMVDLPPNEVPLLRFRSDFHSAPLLRTEYFIINCQKFPFDKKVVRRALATAIDRKTIVEKVLQRGDIASGLLVPPGIAGYNNATNPQVFNPQKAKSLLAAAGFNEAHPFPTLVLHYNKASDRKLVAEAVKGMWEKNLGIKVELLEEEWAAYLERRRKGNYDVSWGGWYGDYPDPNTFLELYVSDNSQNFARWKNEEYDRQMLQAQTTNDLKRRANFFQEAEKIILEEAPILPVLTKAKTYLIQPYVKGYYPNLLDIHPLREVYSLRP